LGFPDRAVVLEAIADLQTLLGTYQQALENYQACLLEVPPQRTALIYYKMAQLNHRQGIGVQLQSSFTWLLLSFSNKTDLPSG
jgi:hypothetical protein